MAARLFKLRNVPEDEAEDIRQLLAEHDIDYYETEAGGWGVSVPAIWMYDDLRLKEAQALLAHYQCERSSRVRSEYQQRKASGQHERVIDRIRQKPLQSLLFFMLTLFILYVTLAPFIHFAA